MKIKRRIGTMMLLALSLCAAQSLVAQSATPGASQLSNPTPTTTCAATFTSGSGKNQTQFCVTQNGNITQFSRGGNEFISSGRGEGYCLQPLNPNGSAGTYYYDYASQDSGNWDASEFSSNATGASITRSTNDGNWQITQTITRVAASTAGPGAAKLSMKVKNLTGEDHWIMLGRWVDVNIGTDPTRNYFFDTADSAYGIDLFTAGLGITNNTFHLKDQETSNAAFFFTNVVPPNTCMSFGFSPFQGDSSLFLTYKILVTAHGTRTVAATYKPI